MKKNVVFNGKEYEINIKNFDDSIDIDELLKIDYSKLFQEILHFPTIMNRFGIMLADMENEVNEKKFNLEIYEAKVREKEREKALQDGKKSLTVDALNSLVILDKAYQILKRNLFKVQKERDYFNSIFWSAKSKDDKLAKLSLSIKVEDLENFYNNINLKKGR